MRHKAGARVSGVAGGGVEAGVNIGPTVAVSHKSLSCIHSSVPTRRFPFHPHVFLIKEEEEKKKKQPRRPMFKCQRTATRENKV